MFRGYRHTIVQVQLDIIKTLIDIYTDTGIPIILVNRQFIRSYRITTFYILFKTSIFGIRPQSINTIEYKLVNLYFKELVEDKERVAKITIEVYLIDNLKAYILLSIDILKLYTIYIDLEKKYLKISTY